MTVIDDIEEISIDPQQPSDQTRISSKQVTIQRFGKKVYSSAKSKIGVKNETISDTNDHYSTSTTSYTASFSSSLDQEQSHIQQLPETQTVWVKTWGCGHNNSDGEYMAGLLASHGYKILLEDSRKQEADMWLLNSCTVKGPSEQTFVNEIQKGKKDGKLVVVAGCVPQADPKGKVWEDLSLIGVQQIDRVVEVVEETFKGHTIKILKEKKDQNRKKMGGATLNLPKIRKNPFIEIIPINTGCLNQCTYCKTKHARGDLGSYSPEEIVERVKSVIEEGVVEIWLTSEDLGAYGRDIQVKVTDLLWDIVKIMEEMDNENCVRLRIGMTNPPYILEHLEEMTNILSHPRVYSFLHVPVQAASDKVLEDMKRQYTRVEFENVVQTLLDGVENMTIATDVICGFPTETAEDFEETLDLINKFKFPVLHISQFYPRRGTPAARLQLLSTHEVKRRSRLLTNLFESYTPHKLEDIKDKVISRVLITDRSSDGIHLVGHDKSYRQILVPIPSVYFDGNGVLNQECEGWIAAMMGKMIDVKGVRCGKYYIVGEPIHQVELHNIGKRDKHTEGNDKIKKRKEKAIAKILPKYVRVKRELIRVDNEDTHEISSYKIEEILEEDQENTKKTIDDEEELDAQKKSGMNSSIRFLFFSLLMFLLWGFALQNPELMKLWEELKWTYKFSFIMGGIVCANELLKKG